MNNHYCKEHEAVFFKKGKMKGYAHPLGDTGEWHNEPEEGGDPMPEEKKAELATEASGNNRGYALSYAKDWCIAKLQAGQDLRSVDVIVCATLFEAYLTNGATVKTAKGE